MKIIDLKYEAQYIPILARWHHQEWSYLNPDGSIEKRIERMQSFSNDALIPSTFIAVENDLLGSAAIVAHDMDTKQELSPWLASVFVSPENRSRGIGSELVIQVMNQARNAGIKTLYLFTPDKEHFYIRLGWQTISNELYRGHMVTVMQVNLKEKRNG
jgi:N-acetylglutamate synthase-like GNAT family acetyltransferase